MASSAKDAPLDDLESVLITAELGSRAWRAPDYATESRILASLAQEMARSPDAILQSLAHAAMSACKAGSAAVSLIESDGRHFRWHALAGALASHLSGTTPRAFSPCGTVVDRASMQLFSYLERHFKYFAEVEPVIVEALLVPFAVDGKAAGAIWVVAHDEQRRFDAEDARLLDNLGRFAAAAYHQRSSLARAEDASRQKDEFLQILLHELRNPLHQMQLMLEGLLERPYSFDELRRVSGVMQRQLKPLQHLAGDLEDLALISRGELQLRKERVALSSVVEQALEASQPLIDREGHRLCVTLPASPVFVDADPIRLAQGITHLLNNAAKLTARGGRVQLTVEAHDTQALVRVQDEGTGIAAELLDGIIEPDARARAEGSAHEGMGIGLALARALVQAHGGTILARSAGPGKGSEFEVCLPRSVDPAQAANVRSARAAPGNGAGALRVLVVDDHRDTADALAWLLQTIGHEARAAYDGSSAIRAFEELSPDVVLQDLILPGTGGLEIAREIRKRCASKAFVVALTGPAQAAALRAAEREAFDHLLVKPVGLAALEEVLSSASSRKAAP